MRPIREAIQKKRAAGSSMGLRLLLYWFTMVLLLMAAILSTLMATGVLSHPAHQLSGTLDIQQRNTYAALDSQMDALTAQSMAMSEKLGKELDAFLAAKGIAFDELNNDPDTIAELEKRLYTPLSNTLGAASCSGIFFGLNVTANTSLPNAEDFRAGLYLSLIHIWLDRGHYTQRFIRLPSAIPDCVWLPKVVTRSAVFREF